MKILETDIYGVNKKIDYFGDNTIIGYLQDKYPDGFNTPVDVIVGSVSGNPEVIEVKDYDRTVDKYEVLIIVHKPAIAAALAITNAFWAWVVNTVALIALNMLVAKIFAPKIHELDQGDKGSAVYNINNANNQAKVGSPIPVGYGTFRMYPSYVEKPYNVYENNEEYLYLLLCIGQGSYNINSLHIGNQEITNSHDVKYKLIDKNMFNDIPTATKDSGYVMRTNTLALPQNYEVNKTPSQYWEINPNSSYIEVDIVAQAFRGTMKNGDIKLISLECYIETKKGSTLTKTTMNWVGKSNSPLRKSIKIATQGATSVRVWVDTKSEDANTMDTLIVQRVKELYTTPSVTEWGDLTLLWVKAKATNGISHQGQSKINGFFTRTDKGNKLDEVVTDIYTNPTYSAGLKNSDLLLPTMPEHVNGVFETKGTIYDALDRTCKSQKYSIFPVGQNVVAKEDKANLIAIHMFDETNILKGTFQAEYTFNEDSQYDGVKCSYRNETTWELEEVIYPSTSIMPNDIELFGVTDKTKATQMVKYFWKQSQSRKMTVSFDTDIEGFSLEFLDKIRVHHASIQDTHSVVYQAQIYGNGYKNIEIKFFGDVGEYETIGLKTGDKITARNSHGRPYTLTIVNVIDDHHYEITPHVSDVTSCVKIGAKDYLVTSVKPKDENAVTVSCVEYDSSIYS